MNARAGRGVVVMLLLAAGCGKAGASASTTGWGGGSAGGEPAAGGATGDGTGAAGAGSGGATGAGGAYGDGTSTAGAGSGGAGETRDGGGVAGVTWLTPPPFPPALATPAGAAVALHAHAVGAQIYTCTASADGGADAGAASYAWVLRAPDAKLYDEAGAQIGTHGAGPSWTSSDGSVARGTKVAELPSPLPGAITWLLLRVSSTSGPGVFADVTYVQRLATAGGTAPATGCDQTTVGTETRAGYTADYYFYRGGAGAAWLEAPANLPDAIAQPSGMTLKLHDHAIGVQIYSCAATGGADAGAGATTFAWTFKAPDALLFDATFTPVGAHGAGPSWTSSDGSTMTARELAHAEAPRADAIPWLLLKEYTQSGAGEFGDVAIVQRLNTAGGQPPATGCDATTVNTLTRVPYSADYYFFVSRAT